MKTKLDYLYSRKKEQAEGNQKRIDALEESRQEKLRTFRVNGSVALARGDYTLFRDAPAYGDAFKNLQLNPGTTY